MMNKSEATYETDDYDLALASTVKAYDTLPTENWEYWTSRTKLAIHQENLLLMSC